MEKTEYDEDTWFYESYIAEQAAQWGADRELEACIDWISVWHGLEHPELLIELLRAARRPKPPSLKEQALSELAEWENIMDIAPDSPIRRALEQLDG
jgi:kynurenine formamidase